MLPYVVHDPRFSRLVIGHANLEKLASGCRWAEGPAYFPAGRYLVWSDIPNDRMMRFDETDASVSVFRCPSNNSNGNTVDREGRLVSCEHLMRRVTRTEHDGSITVLADHYDGRRLNSPNDAVVKSDGSIWFSDPTYGIDGDYEGRQSKSEIGAPTSTGSTATAAKCRSSCRTGCSPTGWPSRRMRRALRRGLPVRPMSADFPRRSGPTRSREHVGAASLFATCPEGLFDGFRCDIHGNIWTSAGRNVFCYAPDGTHLGTIPIGELVANVCFGGQRRNRLYICGQTSLYSIYLNTRAAV